MGHTAGSVATAPFFCLTQLRRETFLLREVGGQHLNGRVPST